MEYYFGPISLDELSSELQACESKEAKNKIFETVNAVLRLSELSDQLDITLETQTLPNWLSPGSRRPQSDELK